MNARIVKGLVFEHATRTWPFIVAALLILLLYASLWIFDSPRAAQYEIEPAAQLMTLFVAAIGLIYATSDGERMTSEIPERTLLLPVPALAIVAVKFAWSIAVIGTLSLVVHGAMELVSTEPRDPWFYYFIVAVVVFAIVQTIALAVGCLGDWSLGILFGAYIVVLTFFVEFGEEFMILPVPVTVALGALLLVSVCLSLSWAVVHLRRTGRWDPQALLPFRESARTAVSKEKPPFSSPLAAQRWFEMRRLVPFAAVYLFCALAVMPESVLPMQYAETYPSDYTDADGIYLTIGRYGATIPFVFLYAAGIAGAFMSFLNSRMQRGPINAFLFIRPISTMDLAIARIAAAIRALGILLTVTALVSIGLGSFWLLIERNSPLDVLTQRWSPAPLVAIICLMFVGVGAFAWAVYWSANVFIAMVVYAVFATIIMSTPDSVFATAMLLGWLFVPLSMASILVFAWRRGLVSISRLARCMAISLVASFALWCARHWNRIWAMRDFAWDFDTLPMYAIGALFLALPVATVPLAMNWARHR